MRRMTHPARDAAATAMDRYLGSRALRGVAVVVFAWLVFVLVTGFPSTDPWATYRIDFDVYRMGGEAFLGGEDLYGQLFRTRSGAELFFTYPPIGAILFSLFSFVSFGAGAAILTGLSIASLVLSLWLVIRALGAGGRDAFWLAVLAGILAVWTIPVRETVEHGQINLILMALVLVDVLGRRQRWWRGSLVGLALSIKLTPAVFLAYFLLRRDWRALAMGIGSALFYTGLGFLLAPDDSWRYWTSALISPERIGANAFATNQSLSGAIHRLGFAGAETVVWFAVCAIIGLACLVLLRRLFTHGDAVMAAMVMGHYALLASPVSWGHHWVWSAPAVVVVLVWAWRCLPHWTGWALAGFAVAGAAVYLLAPHLWFPRPPQQNPNWSWWQQLVGSAYLWWAFGLLLVAWFAAPRAAAGGRSAPSETRG